MSAKAHIKDMKKPKVRREWNDQELRAYYDRTSVLDEGGRIRPLRVAFQKPRRLVALRLDGDILEGVRRVAMMKGLNTSTLMRMWIAERLRRESAE